MRLGLGFLKAIGALKLKGGLGDWEVREGKAVSGRLALEAVKGDFGT